MMARLLLPLLLFAGLFLTAHPSLATVNSKGFADIIDKLLPAVVNISTEHKIQAGYSRRMVPGFPNGNLFEEFRDFFERLDPSLEAPDQEKQVISLGSGFIIEGKGRIVTNYHVIANADEVTVTLNNNEQYKAKVVGFDQLSDLALLQIDAGKELPYVELGDSDEARSGDWVIAVGNPFGFGGSVSVGVVSARGRDVRMDSGAPVDFIQTDAAINRGNSGGPLFNTDGKVIGITTAIYSPSGGNIGIGFAVPSNDFKGNLKAIAAGKKVTRGFLGVKLQEITEEIAEPLGQQQPLGALVAEVVSGSPADKAGVKVGDVIVEFDGVKVDRPIQLNKLVHRARVDSKVEIKVMRRTDQKTNKVTLVAKIAKLDEGGKYKNQASAELMGIKVSNMTPEIRRKLGIKDSDEQGVVVIQSRHRSLRKGDVILRVGNNPVRNVDDFTAAVKEAEKAPNPKSVLLLIKRGGSTVFMGLPIK